MSVLAEVRPLTARSAILSVLLGAHPPEAAGSEIVMWGLRVGISEPAVRVALSRMVASGDLERRNSVYRLTPRLIERQARQDDAIERAPKTWDGTWHVAAVTTVGADSATRASLRHSMTTARFGELREGVWMRPANLDWTPPESLVGSLEVLSATPTRPADELARTLFDLDRWAHTGRELAAGLARTDVLAGRLALAAAVVRHLVDDPLLPAEVLPRDWPGQELREAYAAFRAELLGLSGLSTG
ncbi:PaaX family transcriptional regulator C-terminal domain-containing protein [Aeromicrobium sp.]|uniref:PaaX family transcriptional regulator C-terminal domain-containing protein n=1 Tax=Aeromicrobium sp. TaxID=1871063 RepID=UPI0030C478D5